MERQGKKIGIMGGTFDPVHVGHLILGEAAYRQFNLERVWFMPSGNPPHKRDRTGGATDEQGVEMGRYQREFLKLDTPNLDISSRHIRDMILKGESVKYYLPDPVIQYIYENHIYGS